MSVQSFIEAAHAAECAVAGMALRAVFVRALEADPEVVSLRVSVSGEAPWAIEVEAVDRSGNAVGGWSL